LNKTLKETPLTPKHRDLGARMMGFAGYDMPVSYTTINDEHLTVRDKVGLFDVSHMGQFFVQGEQALDLIQKVTTNDAATLSVGQAQYTCMPNKTGGIIDDLIIYKLDEKEYMLVVNASNIEKDLAWINAANDYEATVVDRSDEMALLALQGPKAAEVLSKLTPVKVDQIPFYYFGKGELAGIEDVLISATGYTGSGGFEIYLDNKEAVKVWEALLKEGAEYGIKPIGLGARDTLRLEMGYCLYGNDIDDSTSPMEAGLGWITKLDKADFISKDYYALQKENGVDRKLVGFKVDDKRVPRSGYEIIDETGEVVGKVTSGTMSPSLDLPIGMGYVPTSLAKRGTKLGIKIRNKILSATVTRLPFYKKKS